MACGAIKHTLLLQLLSGEQYLSKLFKTCRQILYQLSHKGSPRILEWVAYPFSSGSSDPGIKPGFLALQADSLPTELPGKPHGYHVGKPRSNSLGLVCKVGKVAVLSASEMFAGS